MLIYLNTNGDGRVGEIGHGRWCRCRVLLSEDASEYGAKCYTYSYRIAEQVLRTARLNVCLTSFRHALLNKFAYVFFVFFAFFCSLCSFLLFKILLLSCHIEWFGCGWRLGL